MEVKKIVRDWGEAYASVKKYGYVDISTGGGDEWNHKVAERLSDNTDKKVLFLGVTPGYNQEDGNYRFSTVGNNNRQAKSLLSKEY